LKDDGLTPLKRTPVKGPATFARLVSVKVCGCEEVPWVWVPKLRLGEDSEKKIPLPVSVTVWGLPGALSETVRVPVWVPPALGLKATEMVQCAAGARLVSQVFLARNCALAAMEEVVRVAVPVLVRVTVWMGLVVGTAWLAKVRAEDDREAMAPAMPVPVRAIICGLPTALSVMVTVAERGPGAVGAKTVFT
jgi:hypothetical protein